MTTTNSASHLSEMAVAEEATAGTAETTPTKYDYFTGDPGINPTQNVIRQPTVHGRSVMKHILGGYSVNGSIPLMVEPEGILGWFLKWGLGSVSSTQEGATGAYTHTFTPADTIKSFTTWMKRGGNQQIKIPYCVVSGISLNQSVDAGLEATVDFFGQKDEIADDFGTASYSTLSPFKNSDLTVSIDGSTTGQAAQVHNSSIEISNDISADDGKVHGSRFYSSLVPGIFGVNGSMDLWFDDDSEYERFWGDGSTPATSPEESSGTVPLVFTWDTGIEADTGNNYKLVVTIPAAVYETTSVSVGGNRVVQSVSWFGEYDASASAEIKIELTNTIDEYADAT